MTKEIQIRTRRIRFWLGMFVIGLLVSGLTAFFLGSEAALLQRMAGEGTSLGARLPGVARWVTSIHRALTAVGRDYPFLYYGTDWLAFAHIVIAIAFLGPLRDPVKNVWVVEFGMIACVLVIPLALICGPIRGIPFFWRILDCSFGVIGFVPLWIVRREILQLVRLRGDEASP